MLTNSGKNTGSENGLLKIDKSSVYEAFRTDFKFRSCWNSQQNKEQKDKSANKCLHP